MSEAEVFYRLHWDWGTVPFDSANAWSYSVGPKDGQVPGVEECVPCDGTGDMPDDPFTEDGTCSSCHGEGTVDADRGYSCCWSVEDFWKSAKQMGWSPKGDDRVVVFTGEQVGNGCDGEPLVIPTRVVRVMTWDEFTAENA